VVFYEEEFKKVEETQADEMEVAEKEDEKGKEKEKTKTWQVIFYLF
jgi:hypothetical protein